MEEKLQEALDLINSGQLREAVTILTILLRTDYLQKNEIVRNHPTYIACVETKTFADWIFSSEVDQFLRDFDANFPELNCNKP